MSDKSVLEVDIAQMIEWHSAHETSLITHIQFVQIACRVIGVPFHQAQNHDLSKWTDIEFPAYARQHQGDKGDPRSYAYAWLHHIHNNPHHWNYWIFPDGYHVEGVTQNGALPMPERYVREMVADWHGAGRAYQGHWDISEWFDKNLSRMILHTETEKLVFKVMHEIGYEDQMSAGLGWFAGDNWLFKDIAD